MKRKRIHLKRVDWPLLDSRFKQIWYWTNVRIQCIKLFISTKSTIYSFILTEFNTLYLCNVSYNNNDLNEHETPGQSTNLVNVGSRNFELWVYIVMYLFWNISDDEEDNTLSITDGRSYIIDYIERCGLVQGVYH